MQSLFIQTTLQLQKFAITADHTQHIVEIMSYTSGQPAYRLHLLRLLQLFLERSLFGDVLLDGDEVLLSPMTSIGGQRSDGHVFGIVRAVFSTVHDLSAPNLSRGNR